MAPGGCSSHLPENIEVFEVSERLAPFLLFSTILALRTCRKRQFDIVMGGSGLVAPTLWLIARIFDHKVMAYLHGLDLVVGSSLYQWIFIPCIRRLDHVIANSRNTRRLALDKGVPKERVNIINPGTRIPDIPDNNVLIQFRTQHQIQFQKVILFVGRITTRKGLSRFIERCLPVILAAEPQSGLVIVGKNPQHSLNQMGEEKEVLAAVSKLEEQTRVLFLGELTDSDLEACYAMADVQVFPLVETSGDVEGFGMVAIEAAGLGTPTVAFDVGGVADAISDSSGSLVLEDDYTTFANNVIDVLRLNQPSIDSCRSHAKLFSWDRFNTQIRRTIEETVAESR